MPLTRSVPSLRYDTCKTRVALGTRRQTHLLRTGIDRLQKWHPLSSAQVLFMFRTKYPCKNSSVMYLSLVLSSAVVGRCIVYFE